MEEHAANDASEPHLRPLTPLSLVIFNCSVGWAWVLLLRNRGKKGGAGNCGGTAGKGVGGVVTVGGVDLWVAVLGVWRACSLE